MAPRGPNSKSTSRQAAKTQRKIRHLFSSALPLLCARNGLSSSGPEKRHASCGAAIGQRNQKHWIFDCAGMTRGAEGEGKSSGRLCHTLIASIMGRVLVPGRRCARPGLYSCVPSKLRMDSRSVVDPPRRVTADLRLDGNDRRGRWAAPTPRLCPPVNCELSTGRPAVPCRLFPSPYGSFPHGGTPTTLVRRRQPWPRLWSPCPSSLCPS